MKKILVSLLVAVICLGLTPATPTPRAAAAMIGQEQEIKMGEETARALEAKYGVVPDKRLNERVDRIGQSLVAVCGRKDLKYTFKVLNTEDVNALACPGGFIYVFKGLVDYMPSDAELAGVLGHEIGHVVKRHTINQIEKNMWTGLLTMAAGIAAGGGEGMALASVAGQALGASYSRTDERGADKEGFSYVTKAGYSPYAMLITMNKLEDLAKQYGNPGYGLFSSHPEPEARQAEIKKQIDRLKVHPEVIVNKDGTAAVTEGTWRYDLVNSIGNNKAEYRAYLLAGSLYAIRQRGPIVPERFIVFDQKTKAIIYYDDLELLTLYPQDAAGYTAVGEAAKAAAAKLRQWAELANAPSPKTENKQKP